MKRIVIYNEEKIKRVNELIDSITTKGSENITALGEIISIINSGESGEYQEESEDCKNGRMERKKIQSD